MSIRIQSTTGISLTILTLQTGRIYRHPTITGRAGFLMRTDILRLKSGAARLRCTGFGSSTLRQRASMLQAELISGGIWSAPVMSNREPALRDMAIEAALFEPKHLDRPYLPRTAHGLPVTSVPEQTWSRFFGSGSTSYSSVARIFSWVGFPDLSTRICRDKNPRPTEWVS